MVDEGTHSVKHLKATIQKMEIALGAIGDAVVWLDEHGRVQSYNPAFERLINPIQTNVLGSPIVSLLPLQQDRDPIPPATYPHIRLQTGDYRVTEYEVQQRECSLVVEISGQSVELENDRFIVLVIRDLTPMKRVTTAHQQSEQEVLSVLRATLESTGDGLLVVNQALEILVVNQKFVQMFSVPKPLLLPGLGQERLDFLANQTQNSRHFIESVQELLENSPQATSLDVVEMKDGQIFERYSQPLYQGKQIAGRVWSFRDITDYKHSEKALKRSEQKFRHLFENSQVGIFRTRIEDGLFLEANQYCLELFGCSSAEEMIGCKQTNDFLVNPSDRELMLRELLPEGRLNNYEAQFQRQDGTRFWVLCSIYLNAEENCLDTVITDITDRQQAEDALRQSEAQFRALFETTNTAVMIVDEEGVLDCNPALEELFGYSRQELFSKTLADLSPPLQPNGQDSYRCVQEHLDRALGEGNHRFEWIHCRADRTHFPAEVGLTAVEVGDRKFIQAVVRDLTERKQAEESLRLIVEGTAAKTGEEFFQSCVRYLVEVLQVRYAWVVEVANEAKTRVRILAFWAGDSLDRWEYNLASEYDLHQTPCATVYQDRTSYYPENLQSLFPHASHLVALGAESYLGMVLTDSSGHTLGHLAVLDVKPMDSNPGRELIVKIFASRAGAELERKQTEEKFVKAFRSSPSPIAIATLSENRFIDVNSSFLKMCGYSLEETIGHTSSELKLEVEEGSYNRAIQQALRTGSLQNQEFQICTKSGEVRTVLLSIELIDLAGIQCVLNIINDITERKRLENELISLVSHELRTPMTSLLGALDLLGSGQLGTLTAQGQQVLTIATNNTERLTRLVNDILDLERMKSGKIVMQKIECNLANLMTQAIEAMQAMATTAKITLVSETLDIKLSADPDRIVQTLTNLLSNAIKFSQPGGTVWLSCQRRSNAIEIQVKDCGRGIPEDKLQLIFDRFQQVDASDSRQKGGTGLGLAICRNIVEQHEGKIWVQSVLGRGSTFYITLPFLS